MNPSKFKPMKQPQSHFVKGRHGYHPSGTGGKTEASSDYKVPLDLKQLRAYGDKLFDLAGAKKNRKDAQRQMKADFHGFESARSAESLLDSELASLENKLVELETLPVETVKDVEIAKGLKGKKPTSFNPTLETYGKRADVTTAAIDAGFTVRRL